MTKPGWSKPHTHSNPTNLASFRRKITLYRFNQGADTIAGGLKWEQGAEPPEPPHFNHCDNRTTVCLFFFLYLVRITIVHGKETLKHKKTYGLSV